MLEALARGVPVLAAATGTAPELLADEVAGVLLPDLSVDALDSGLRRAAARTFDCRAIAERVRLRHEAEVVAGQQLAHYRAAGVDLP
jgi:glycosyltransferase involved in cell wall biosynthesis